MTDSLTPIAETVSIQRPIESVWRTLTESTPDWLGCMRYRNEVGSTFFLQQDAEKAARGDVSGATHCEILALEAPRLFRFSWFIPGSPATTVTFRLETIDDSTTRVRFVHDGWDQFRADDIRSIRDLLAGGWRGHSLPSLKRLAEA